MTRKRITTIRELARNYTLTSELISPVCCSVQPEQGLSGKGSNCTMANSTATAKRIYDVFFSALGLFLLSPIFLLVCLLLKFVDGGNIFYGQLRIGQNGLRFRIWKFRTMVPGAEKMGPSITSDLDPRITRIGRFLRKTKLDELPQLWNVFRGDMSLVGPRPEVPRYVEQFTPQQRAILRYKPGITDLASLRFRNEESLLVNPENSEKFYVEQCVPRKLKLNQEYVERANLLTDTWIIVQTICPYWLGVLAVYGIILTSAFWCSCCLISDFTFARQQWHQFLGHAPIVITLQLGSLLLRRHCKGLLCYFGIPELRRVTIGLSLACFLLMTLPLVVKLELPPANLILTDFLISILFLSGFRLLLRLWRERADGEQTAPGGPPMRVGIIGAGILGAHLARTLNGQKGFGRTAVAFFDDDPGTWQKHIHEIPVVGMPECLLQGWRERLDEVAIALPKAEPSRLQEITQLFENTKLKVYTVRWPSAAWPSLEPAAI